MSGPVMTSPAAAATTSGRRVGHRPLSVSGDTLTPASDVKELYRRADGVVAE